MARRATDGGATILSVATTSAKPPPLTGGAIRAGTSQLVTAATGALTTLLLARILGPTGSGVFAIALTFQLGLLTLGTFGLQTGLSYLVAAKRWDPANAFVATQWAALVIGVVVAAVGLGIRLIAGAAFAGLDTQTAWIAVAAVPFGLSWTFASSLALAVDNYDLYAIPTAFQSVLMLLIAPVAAAVWGVEEAIAATTVTHAATAAWLGIAVQRIARKRSREAETPLPHRQLWPALIFGLKGHASNILSFLNYRLDMFILNAYAPGADVGRYSIAVSVTTTVWLLPRAAGRRGDAARKQCSVEVASTTRRNSDGRDQSVRHTRSRARLDCGPAIASSHWSRGSSGRSSTDRSPSGSSCFLERLCSAWSTSLARSSSGVVARGSRCSLP